MVVSSRSPRHRQVRAALALALTTAALLVPSVPAATAAAPAIPAASGAFTTRDAPVLLARAGAGTHSFSRGRTGYGSRGYGSRGYGYGYRRSSGGSFVHGLFVGWTLGHFFGFGGGIPLFPLLFVVVVLYLMLRGGGGRGSGRHRRVVRSHR
jgi:uncharacterized membrane protein